MRVLRSRLDLQDARNQILLLHERIKEEKRLLESIWRVSNHIFQGNCKIYLCNMDFFRPGWTLLHEDILDAEVYLEKDKVYLRLWILTTIFERDLRQFDESKGKFKLPGGPVKS